MKASLYAFVHHLAVRYQLPSKYGGLWKTALFR